MKKKVLGDDELINFLQTYYPTTPPEKKPCEELIMRVIATELSCQKTSSKLITKSRLLAITFISSILMIGGYFFHLSVPNKSSPQIAEETENLETFMVNSWYGSMAQESELQFVNINREF